MSALSIASPFSPASPHLDVMILTTACATGQLPLCSKLVGLGERNIILQLILRLDPDNLAQPVALTILRLCEISNVRRASLCEKLTRLRQIGILQPNAVHGQIAFSEEAVAEFIEVLSRANPLALRRVQQPLHHSIS